MVGRLSAEVTWVSKLNMKALCIVSICLTSLVLLVYPFVLVANIMAITAVPPANPSRIFMVTSAIFLGGTTLYPVPYLIALIASLWNIKKNVGVAFFWQVALMVYLLVIGVSLVALLMFG